MLKILVTISLEKQHKKHTTINEIKLPGQTITLTNELLLMNYKVFNDNFRFLVIIGPSLSESVQNEISTIRCSAAIK